MYELALADNVIDERVRQVGKRALGVHQARGNAVDPYPIAGQFGGESDGQTAYSSLDTPYGLMFMKPAIDEMFSTTPPPRSRIESRHARVQLMTPMTFTSN